MSYDHDPEWILEVRRWLQLVKKLAQQKAQQKQKKERK